MNDEEKKATIEFANLIQQEVSDLKDGVFVKALESKIDALINASSSKTIGTEYTSNQRDRDMGMVDGLLYVLQQIKFYTDMDLSKEDLQKTKK